MKRYEVERIFGGIVCPYCNEQIVINDETNNLDDPFPFFGSNSPEFKPDCHQFNSLLNEKFFALRDGNLSEADFQVWASQYKP